MLPYIKTDVLQKMDEEISLETINTQEYVKTNMGLIPLGDYYDIRAMQYGFDDYEDMRKQGYSIEKPETFTSEFTEEEKELGQ